MKRMKSSLLLVAAIVMVFSQMVFASSSWTDARTWSLTAGAGYSTTTTAGTKLGANKTTDKSAWDVYTVAKTMVTTPTAKLVNSSGSTRSDVVNTASAGRYNSGSTNTGTIGYAEYLSVKPGALQTGTDTIKLQMRNY